MVALARDARCCGVFAWPDLLLPGCDSDEPGATFAKHY